MMVRLTRLFILGALIACGFSTGIISGAAALGDEPAAPAAINSDSSTPLEEAVDREVDIELSSGTLYPGATLLRVVMGKEGEIDSLRIRLDTGRSRSIRLGAVRSITCDGKVIYQTQGKSTSKPTSKKQQKAEEEAQQKAEEHEKWLGRLQARGVEPWTPLTDEQHKEMIKRHKEKYAAGVKAFPDLYMVETEQYLFCSNMPRQHADVYIGYLDNMYTSMRAAYGLDDETAVWCGKASVYAFNTIEQFALFEQKFMDNADIGFAQGLCHHDWERSVTISCHIGTNPLYLGTLLVHETSHGFVFCYKTKALLPSWVNEGMAENVAMMMVTKDKGIERRIDDYIKGLRQSPAPRLGADFFERRQIDKEQYGGAASMIRFLMVTDQKKFVQFIDLLKEGVPWEEALESSYKAKKDDLVKAYGKWIQVPNLAL